MALSISWTMASTLPRRYMGVGGVLLSSRPRRSTCYSSRASEDLSRGAISGSLEILNISEKAVYMKAAGKILFDLDLDTKVSSLSIFDFENM